MLGEDFSRNLLVLKASCAFIKYQMGFDRVLYHVCTMWLGSNNFYHMKL